MSCGTEGRLQRGGAANTPAPLLPFSAVVHVAAGEGGLQDALDPELIGRGA